MAMSLEDLLAKEGFKRRKPKIRPSTSSVSEGRGAPLYMQQDRHENGSLMAVKRTERAKSHIPRYDYKGEFSTDGCFTGRIQGGMHLGSEKRNSLNYERRGHRTSWEDKRCSIGSSKELPSCEIVEVGMNSSHNDRYSNSVYSHKHSHVPHVEQRLAYNAGESSDNRSYKTSRMTNHGESRSLRQDHLEDPLAAPALEEVAVKAVISILSGYSKRFVEDEDFRTSLHHNTFASLDSIALDEGLNTQSKVMENLEQAIEIVERAAEDDANLKELKKASLKLSVITGLNSNDLKDGFTSGIPNARLSACAHLYLSVIYVLQKKDGIAAKHLLQVFCDSPFQARTTLLPDLWEHVFLPHLSHLKLWYDNETRSLAESPILINLKRLVKVYNESLDLGTYQFAMYYKDWIMDGVEAPAVPIIRIPSFSVQRNPNGGLLGRASSPASHHSSPQTMVSKELYVEVFRHLHKGGVESEGHEEAARSSSSPAPDDKQLILYTHDKRTQHSSESSNDNMPVVEEERRLQLKSPPGEANPQQNLGACKKKQGNLQPSKTEYNHLSEVKKIEDSFKHQVTLETVLEPLVHEVKENSGYLRGEPFICSIPKDFVCPLTGLLFRDPVTLETGHTFELEAITDWFGKGWITCPVTRKTLHCKVVPTTNLILKRVIDKWKTDHIDRLLDSFSELAAGSNANAEGHDSMIICILGQLVPTFRKDERVTNGRRVISSGGLQFLVKRFLYANTQEKTFILSLLCCCIEADGGCRNDIARNINLSSLLQMLRHEQLKLRTVTVLLLIELICFNRRTKAMSFLEGLSDQEILNATDHLIMHLQSFSHEQRPLVAVLILNLDLLSDRQNTIFRQEAVDALTVALRQSLSDEKVEKKCCRALLILGGFFSSSGKLMTEDWILKLAGFLNGPDGEVAEDEPINDIVADGTVVDYANEEGEESAREKWLVRLSASLLGDGNKSFLDAVCKCLISEKSELVRVCLTTVAWLSFSITSLHRKGSQMRALSTLASPLKECLENGQLVEHKILASLCLHNLNTMLG